MIVDEAQFAKPVGRGQEELKPAARSNYIPTLDGWRAIAIFWVIQSHSELLQIVATAMHPGSLVSRVLECAPLRFIGRISYSLYLWQQLFFGEERAGSARSLHLASIYCWCATFACALASYYLVETPMIRWGHRLAKRFDHGSARPCAATPQAASGGSYAAECVPASEV